MNINDLQTRKAKLQEYCLSIGWHGGYWETAMKELERLNAAGIKTRLEIALENGSFTNGHSV